MAFVCAIHGSVEYPQSIPETNEAIALLLDDVRDRMFIGMDGGPGRSPTKPITITNKAGYDLRDLEMPPEKPPVNFRSRHLA
jgi:hypothetical protein